MSEYLDYDEAVRANRARKKKAMAMKKKRQAALIRSGNVKMN